MSVRPIVKPSLSANLMELYRSFNERAERALQSSLASEENNHRESLQSLKTRIEELIRQRREKKMYGQLGPQYTMSLDLSKESLRKIEKRVNAKFTEVLQHFGILQSCALHGIPIPPNKRGNANSIRQATFRSIAHPLPPAVQSSLRNHPIAPANYRSAPLPPSLVACLAPPSRKEDSDNRPIQAPPILKVSPPSIVRSSAHLPRKEESDPLNMPPTIIDDYRLAPIPAPLVGSSSQPQKELSQRIITQESSLLAHQRKKDLKAIIDQIPKKRRKKQRTARKASSTAQKHFECLPRHSLQKRYSRSIEIKNNDFKPKHKSSWFPDNTYDKPLTIKEKVGLVVVVGALAIGVIVAELFDKKEKKAEGLWSSRKR